MVRAAALVIGLLSLFTLAPSAEAAAIYFTEEVLGAEPTPGCGSFIPTYAATLTTPTGAGGQIVPPFAAGGLGCPAIVSWTADKAMTFSGDSTVRLFLSCEVAGLLQGVQVDWRHNGETVTEGNAVTFIPEPTQCAGGSVEEIIVPIGSDAIAIAVGDVIEVDVIIFEYLPNAPYNPAQHIANRHIKVNSPEYPSGLYNAGIPESAGPAPTGNTSDTGTNSTSSSPATTSSASSTSGASTTVAQTTTSAGPASDESTATGGFPLQEDKDTPASGLLSLLLVLAVAAFAVRRRLA